MGETLLNRYLVRRALGEGAMGQVWLVEDVTTGRLLALKVIASKLAATESSALGFIQEFRVMTQLRHPNCCEVVDYGVLPDGQPYLTMELVEGRGLDELLPLPSDQFVPVLSQILQALGYLHARGYVHCDLKPENVRVRPDGVVKLMDYGLMEYAGRSEGAIKGTLAYMAPEMIKRGTIDRRADLYSVGCLAYQLLADRVPFSHERPGDVLRAHLGDLPVPPSRLRAGVELHHEQIALRLMAKEPTERYQHADEVLAALNPEGQGATGLLASPLMGRAQEMAKLFMHLAKVATGKPGGLVWLEGPAGVGKSRLVEEFGYNVRLENLPLAVGHAHEFAASPYGPFAGVLRALWPACKELVPDALKLHAPALGRLLPEAGGKGGDASDVALQGAIVGLLAALARRQGVVVVLDAWHWADERSRDVLARLAAVAKDVPLLCVVSSRAALPEGLPATRLALGPLNQASSDRMVAAMLGMPEAPQLIALPLWTLAEGSPRHLEILLAYLVGARHIAKDVAGWVPLDELDELELPQGLLALLGPQLDEAALRLARAASVFGDGFPGAIARRLAGPLQDASFRALVAHGVFVEQGGDRCRFANPSLRELLYASLGEPDRRFLHLAAGRQLDQSQHPTLEVLTQVADQYARAGDPALAAFYTLEAGHAYLDKGADGPAERYLLLGLNALPQSELIDEPAVLAARAAGLAALGQVLERTSRMEQARLRYDEAIGIAEYLDDRARLSKLLARLAPVWLGLGDLKAALAVGERAMRIAAEVGDLALAARCRLVNARTRQALGRDMEAMVDATASLALARELGEPSLLGLALATVGQLAVTTDAARLGEGLAYLHEAVERLAEHPGELAEALAMLAEALAGLGEFVEAGAAYERSLAAAREAVRHRAVCEAQLGLAACALELGALHDAVAAAREGARVALGVQSTYQMALGVAIEAHAQSQLGRLGEAKALMHVASDLAAGLSHLGVEARVERHRLEISLLVGDLEDATATAERLQVLAAPGPERLYLLLGQLMIAEQDYEGASSYLDSASSMASLALARGVEARALAAQAHAAMRRERWVEARDVGLAARAIATELKLDYLAASVDGVLGEVRLALGEREAEASFAHMGELAVAGDFRLLGAIADFGRAAAQPYAPGAAELAASAGTALGTIAQSLDAEARERFCAPLERKRVLAGNYIAFSLPIAAKNTRPLPGGGMWKMM